MKLAIVFAVLLVAVSALHEAEFAAFKSQFGKTYASADEHILRMKIFSSNVDYINSWNKEHTAEFDTKLAINQFTDLTNLEFKAIVLGHSPVPHVASATYKPVGDRPASVDWREKGIVTPVKNQGSCGSCWAFSTVGAMEGAWAKEHEQLVAFSEQQLVDCSTSYGNDGCNGGLMSMAMDYILVAGAETETDYAYKGKNQKCAYDASKATYKFSKYVNITTGSEEELTDALANQGPVAVAIDASHMSFQFYSSGIYKEKKCKNGENDLDHGVLAVGYGFTTADTAGNQYYIVKNSWAASWGQKGYIWMERNNNNACGIATCSLFVEA